VLHTTNVTTEAIDRFLREARAIFPLRSENVCRVLDLGRLPEGAPYIVMEFLDGTDFATAFRATQVPPARAAAYMAQACKGLAEAHALGIVHRDIKPANLFLTKRSDGAELVKVLDFGISKLRREGDESLTAEGQVLGTPRYMSPEQFGGASEADARADVWAIGLVLYKLIAGRLPYTAVTIADIYAELMNRDPEDIRRAVPGIDPALGAVVMRCLERRAAKRFASARELGAALDGFARSAGNEVLAVAAAAQPDAPPTIAERAPRNWLAWGIVVFAALALVTSAGLLYAATHATPPVTSASVTVAPPPPPATSTPATSTASAVTSSSAPAGTTSVEPNRPKPPAPTVHAPNCSVPYIVTSSGVMKWRPECVH
jgi:serine/threonine-protein kinase